MPAKNKIGVSISLDKETKERLQQYAVQKHSSVSQVITDWIWSVKLDSDRKK